MAEQIYFEDVSEGYEITVLEKGPIEHAQLVRYACASGDYNPIHLDHEAARKSKLDGVIAHGMLSMGFLGQLMTDWIGDGELKKLGVSFRGMVKLGDVLTCQGRVVKKLEKDGEGIVECELFITNQDDQKLTTGTAVASLPLKS
jgi:acyl dehydratase